MSHFAKIDGTLSYTVIDGISAFYPTVTQTIVAEQDFINSGDVGEPSLWVQTSFNNNIRNVFGVAGFVYNTDKDIFHSPQPYQSWLLSAVPFKTMDANHNIVVKTTLNWIPPIPKPPALSGASPMWDEYSKSWIYT
jgi:hypothetical protein